MTHNLRMHLTGYSGLRPLVPAAEPQRWASCQRSIKKLTELLMPKALAPLSKLAGVTAAALLVPPSIRLAAGGRTVLEALLQLNLAQLYYTNDKNLLEAKNLIDIVISEFDGKRIFFCCEFSGGRSFAQSQFIELKQKIEKKLAGQ